MCVNHQKICVSGLCVVRSCFVCVTFGCDKCTTTALRQFSVHVLLYVGVLEYSIQYQNLEIKRILRVGVILGLVHVKVLAYTSNIVSPLTLPHAACCLFIYGMPICYVVYEHLVN